MIPLSIPVIAGNEWKYVKECLDTGWVSSVGSYVTRFEKDIATYVGAPYAVATVNGTAALHVSLMLCDINPGDEVVVPTLTFIAPVNAVKYLNANPIFMDCDDYLNIDVEKTTEFCEKECKFDGRYLINKITGAKIKAIIVVHIFGHPANIEPLKELAFKFNLKLIEDATESLGSFYRTGKFEGKKTGTIGDIGCYSFNGNKIITTGGGGMIVTHSKELADKAKYLTTQAKDDAEKFVHHDIGYNYRLTNIQAAMGCAQLESLNNVIEIKRNNFNFYHKKLDKIKGLSLINEPGFGYSNYWYYTLIIDSKQCGISSEFLRLKLKEAKIETRPVWELNHRQRPYNRYQIYKIDRSIKYQDNALNLPCSVNLSSDHINNVCKVIEEVICKRN